MPERLKIALVTDIHNGRDSLTKKGGAAVPLLQAFRAFVADEQPDLVAELGDRISDASPEADHAAMAEVAAELAALPVPFHALMGNHDRVHLTVAQNEALLGQGLASHSLDLKGWHLVFWQADTAMSHAREPALSEADLDWLRDDLAATSLPAIIFSHIPLDGASMTGNFYFQANPQFATYGNLARAQAIITGAGNVAMCVAGHVHWNNLSRIGGIPFLSLQSLTESYTTQGEASGAWAVIEADAEGVSWRGYGQDPIELKVHTGGGNRRWAEPLAPFHELARERARPLDFSGKKALLLDLDGVVYRGDVPIAGSVECLNWAVEHGYRLAALTNNARASAAHYRRKLGEMGLNTAGLVVVTAAHATVRMLTELNATGVFVAAHENVRGTIRDSGIAESDSPSHVVAGIDEDMPLSRLTEAVRHLRRGAVLVATNDDRTIPSADGLAPEAGAVVAYLEAASGQKALIAGKPGRIMYDMALEQLGLPADAAVMIGDTLETDIQGANNAGIASVLVQSGNPPDPLSQAIPDMTMADLAALGPALYGAGNS